MSMEHACPCTAKCPLQRAMEAIGGKWKMAILCSLSISGTVRVEYEATQAVASLKPIILELAKWGNGLG